VAPPPAAEPVPVEEVDEELDEELDDDDEEVVSLVVLVLPPDEPVGALPPAPFSVSSSQAAIDADPNSNAKMLTKIVRFIDPSPAAAFHSHQNTVGSRQVPY
jgi:hypothetical protein